MKPALKASIRVSLFALVLGLTALSAAIAQGETGAYWEVNGLKMSNELLPAFNLKQDTPHIVLLFTIAAKVELECSEIKMVNGLLHKSGKTTGKLDFGSCITKINGTDGKCNPHSPGAAAGLIESNALNGLLVLHKEGEIKEDLLELSPAEGETFATLVLGPTGKECVLLLDEHPIKGRLFLKDSQKELSVNKVNHLFEEQKALSKLVILSTHSVNMDGSFLAFLSGFHSALTWSGHTA